jgi:hypothetical protein
VDEAGVRTLLNQLADTEPPRARIDLDAAIVAGRRGRRWRRVRAGASVLLAAGAAAVAVVALLVGPAQRPGHQAAGGTVGPARFNVLAPYASFGWLPPGFQAGAVGGTTPRTTAAQLLLVAFSRSASIELEAYPAGTCHLAGQTLACSAYNTASPAQGRAPDVNGHQAYWLKGAGLAWEYAPGAWSILDWTNANLPWPPARAERTAVLRVAAGVRYGQTTPIRFPYWISGLPAAWRVSEVDYTLVAGQPVPQTLHLDDGPGNSAGLADVDDLQVYVTQAAHSGWSCPKGSGQHVTVDGVAAVLVDSPAASREQRLCIPDWRGLQVEVLLAARENAPAPDPTGPYGVLAYARMLHPLGPDPAHWTANPLR